MQTPSYPKSYKKFINDVEQTALDNGIKIRSTNDKLVYSDPTDTIGCAGYFSEFNMELAFSTYDSDISKWMGLIIHESCHMDQFLNDKSLWNKCSYGLTNFFLWLDHEIELTDYQMKKNRDLVIALELDCEKRAIAKMKKYKLPMDIKKYKQKSNTYFYGIMYCGIKRQWFNRVYSKYEIWSKAPDRFQRQYTSIPPVMFQAFEKHIN